MQVDRNKILIITPLNPYPIHSGVNIRLLDLVILLQEKYTIDICYYGNEEFEENLIIEIYKVSRAFKINKVKKSNNWLTRKLFKLAKLGLASPSFAFNRSPEDFIDNVALNNFSKKIQKYNYKAAISFWLFNYPFLKLLDNKTIRIIDSHDKLTDRWKNYFPFNEIYYWYSVSRNREQKILSAADLTIAIQKNELFYFKNDLNIKNVLLLTKKVFYKNLRSGSFNSNLLLVAGKNRLNKIGIDWFIENCLELLRDKIENLNIIVAGSVCDYYNSNIEGITFFGRFDNLEEVYRLGDIVINPMLSGTGLKLKSLEALSFGKFLVSTKTGVDGFEEYNNKAFLIANEPMEFTKAIMRIINSGQERKRISQGIEIFIEQWNQEYHKQGKELINFIEGKR